MFDPELRKRRQELFRLERTTGGGAVRVELGGKVWRLYKNANFSIYSGQTCNARCGFCVEELRPLSRGVELSWQKKTIASDEVYFQKLASALAAVAAADPSVSITGGEASIDPRLPGILERVVAANARKRTLTTNASGLLQVLPDGRRVVDAIVDARMEHLNVSRASPDDVVNQRIMQIGSGSRTNDELAAAVSIATAGGVSVRLSCVLLKGVTESVADIVRYLEWARSLGVSNVIFRQLMQHDPERAKVGPVTLFSDARRVRLWDVLEEIQSDRQRDPRFTLAKQILGYYYYVEVYEYQGMSCVFEGADLAEIRHERERAANVGDEDVIHELIFHPSGTLNSTWQPWDGVLLA